MTTTISVPLDKLVPGAKAKDGSINSRKADAPVDGLAHSIAMHGLLVPLLVRGDSDGSFYVLDGNRRLEALRLLAKKDLMYVDPILCIEVADGNALELSAVVNVDREELHPVDRFEVFAALVQAGATADDLAKRYGIKIAAVRQALALGRMAPEVRDAWRAGKIEDEVAEAFTVTTDHKAQAAALKRAGNTRSSYHVRRELTGDVDVASMLRFVGRAAYEKAGYEINETLFSERGDDVVVSDIGALKGLAMRKLSDACDELTKAGWKWAVTVVDAPRDWLGWRRDYSPKHSKEAMAQMGCVVSVGLDAKIRIERGVVKPGDKVAMPKAKASPKAQAAAAAERAQRKEETGGLSNALAHRLSQQLTAAVREAFAARVGADDLVALTIAALACAGGPTRIRLGTEADEDRHENDFSKYFKLARGKTAPQRHAMLAQWLAQSIDLTAHQAPALIGFLHPGKGFDRSARQLVECIDQGVMLTAAAKHFDAADYFASVSKDLIVEAVRDALGKEHGDRVAKMKASEAREYAIKHMAKIDWVPETMRI